MESIHKKCKKILWCSLLSWTFVACILLFKFMLYFSKWRPEFICNVGAILGAVPWLYGGQDHVCHTIQHGSHRYSPTHHSSRHTFLALVVVCVVSLYFIAKKWGSVHVLLDKKWESCSFRRAKKLRVGQKLRDFCDSSLLKKLRVAASFLLKNIVRVANLGWLRKFSFV